MFTLVVLSLDGPALACAVLRRFMLLGMRSVVAGSIITSWDR